MANNVDSTRNAFFPSTAKTKMEKSGRSQGPTPLSPFDQPRTNEREKAPNLDAKIDIPNSIKDFSKIKRSVDQAQDIDKSAQINELKEKIKSGAYKIDYDALADKMIEAEF